MAEEVEIIGVDGGPASEATLKRILDEMKRRKSSNNQARRFQDLYNEALRRGTKTVRDFDNQIDKTTESVKTLGDRIGSVANMMKIGLGATLGFVTGMQNLSKELLLGRNRLTDYAQHFPLAGEQLATFTSFLDSSIDQLRIFSTVGVSFNNDIKEMFSELTKSGVNIEALSQTIVSNSDAMKILGSTVLNGTKRFILLNKQLGDSGIRQNLLNLGFTVEDITEGLISYARIEAARGRAQRISNAQLLAGTQSYLKELDLLAKYTGMSRKEAESIIVAQQSDALIAAIKTEIEARNESTVQFDANTARLEHIERQGGGAVVTALKGLADGIANTPLEANLVAATNGYALTFMQQYRRNELTQEKFNEGLRKMEPMITNFMNSPEAIGALRAMGNPIADLKDGAAALRRITTVSEIAAKKEQEARDETTSGLFQFEDMINRMRAMVLTPMLDALIPKINKFMEGTFTDENINKFLTNFQSVINFLADPVDEIKEAYQYVKKSIMDFLYGSVEYDEHGMKLEYPGLFDSMADAFSDFWNNSSKVINAITTFLDKIATSFTTVLGKVWDNIAPSWLGGDDDMDEIVSKLTDDQRKEFERIKGLTGRGNVETKDKRLGELLGGESEIDTIVSNLTEAQRYEFEKIKYWYEGEGYKEIAHEMLRRLAEKLNISKDTAEKILIQKFNKGTKGFEDFGKGTLAMLHNREAVIPLNSKLGQSLNALMEPGQSQRVEIPYKPQENTTTIQPQQTTTIVSRPQRDDIKQNLEQLNNTMMQVVGLLQQNSKENREINSSLKKMRGIVY